MRTFKIVVPVCDKEIVVIETANSREDAVLKTFYKIKGALMIELDKIVCWEVD